MKTRFLFFALVLAVLTSCSKHNAYEDAVPGDVLAAARVDLSTQNPLVRLPFVSKFVEPIEKLKGLDLTSPIYVVQVSDKQFGLVGHVQDEEDLKQSLQNLKIPARIHTQVTEDVVVALYAPELNSDSAQAILDRWLAQTTEQSLLQQNDWKWLVEGDNLMAGQWQDYRFHMQKTDEVCTLHLQTITNPDLLARQLNEAYDRVKDLMQSPEARLFSNLLDYPDAYHCRVNLQATGMLMPLIASALPENAGTELAKMQEISAKYDEATKELIFTLR